MAYSSPYYVLEGTKVVQVDSVEEWALKFNEPARIGLDEGNGYRVSTVFLGVDHSFGSGPPLLFETMVFEKDHDEVDMERCSTYEQALFNHEYYVKQYIGLQEEVVEEAKEVKKIKNFTDDIEE